MGKHLFFAIAILTLASCSPIETLQPPMSPLTIEDAMLVEDMYESISAVVDEYYGNDELRKERVRSMNHMVDTCHADIANFHSFAEMQNYFVIKHLENRPSQMQYHAGFFDTPTDINKIFPTSLISHEMCPIDKAGLTHTLYIASRVPDDDTILKINEFSNLSNTFRKNYLENPTYQNKLLVSQHWAKLMKCLSYIESLTTADTNASIQTALNEAPPDYRKPAGVSFYRPSADAKLNIGAYQFDPSSTGNVRVCIRQWNVLFPDCAVSLNADEDEMIRTLGSELQTFNIFCGIDKLSQMFSVQVNTTNSSRTSLVNNVNNNLKTPENRCVTINSSSEMGYNHFGPFQNSSGKNLKALMACYFD